VILVATLGGPPMFARIGIMRAFNILALQLEAGAFLGSFPS
jgi:hypothetical protein